MTVNEELGRRLRSTSWPSPVLAKEEFTAYGVKYLVNSGLEVLAICLGGEYRSGVTTNRLNSIGIATLRLEKGIEGNTMGYFSDKFEDSLACIPIIAVIMSTWEYSASLEKSKLLKTLQKKANLIHYPEDDSAVEEIMKIYRVTKTPISTFIARTYSTTNND